MNRLHDIMELMYIEKYTPSNDDINEILAMYSEKDLIDLSVDFLNGINNKHQVPGKIILTIAGIGHFYNETNMLTTKQKFYLFHNIQKNWDQINLEYRTYLKL